MRMTLFRASFTLAFILLLAGCQRPTAKSVGRLDQVVSKKDPTKQASEIVRQANSVEQFRLGLNHLSPIFEESEFAKRLLLTPEDRAFLKDQAHLSEAELTEVESSTFKPADAYYLEECTALRDAVRSHETNSQKPGEQVLATVRWVARHVVYFEQGDPTLPSCFVLKRGFGNVRDRAILMLGLARQYQLEGCVFVLPGVEPRPVLVGLIDRQGNDLYLADPRLGQVVVKEGGELATWKDVQKDPKLLEPHGISVEDMAKLEAWLVTPWIALAPRMKELERILSSQDRIRLYLDPTKLNQAITNATKGKVLVWNEPGKENRSPTRLLREYLPVEEGGVEPTHPKGEPARFKRFEIQRVPWSNIFYSLEQLGLASKSGGELPEAARDTLLGIVNHLFKRYVFEPEEFLLHGQYEQVITRLDRINNFLEDDAVLNNPNFPRELAEWRLHVRETYRGAQQSKEGRNMIAQLWGNDLFLNTLLSEVEDRAVLEEEERRQSKKNEKTVLTQIVAFLCRDTLVQRTNWLVANCWQDKAEGAQMLLQQAEPGNVRAVKTANEAWLNTRGAWSNFLSRQTFRPNALKQRLHPIHVLCQRQQPGDLDRALSMLEKLHFDIDRYFTAKVYFGEALGRVEGAKAEQSYHASTALELEDLLPREEKKAGFVDLKREIEQILRLVPPDPNLRASFDERANTLLRNWSEHGAFASLRQGMVRGERRALAP